MFEELTRTAVGAAMIRRELMYFMLNGLISVAIAYGVYRGLVINGFMIEVSNGIAYIAGMAYGFFANKRLTFRDGGKVSISLLAGYVLLHMGTLLVNIGVNSAMLGMLRGLTRDMPIAFLISIAASTVLNFLGMKYWVFKQSFSVFTGSKSERAVKL
jgi:putative flippase GtrA